LIELKPFETSLFSILLHTACFVFIVRIVNQAAKILQDALSERKTLNPSYSLRAFARDLGLAHSQLSLVMNGQRGFRPEAATAVAQKLGLDSKAQESFLTSLKAQFSKSRTEKQLAIKKMEHLEAAGQVRSLEVDLFQMVSSWHHFGLIELVKIGGRRKNFNQKNFISWAAEKLELSELEAALSLERLERLELIEKTATGLRARQDGVLAEYATPTEAIKKFHQQMLQKASAALVFQGPSERYGVSHTLPVSRKSLPRAKKMIQDFRITFANELSDPEGGEEIYGLSLQYFRLTKETKK
jgi:uncharacterized protein (TIGR02147 family)